MLDCISPDSNNDALTTGMMPRGALVLLIGAMVTDRLRPADRVDSSF
jgi:hypothetical protein